MSELNWELLPDDITRKEVEDWIAKNEQKMFIRYGDDWGIEEVIRAMRTTPLANMTAPFVNAVVTKKSVSLVDTGGLLTNEQLQREVDEKLAEYAPLLFDVTSNDLYLLRIKLQCEIVADHLTQQAGTAKFVGRMSGVGATIGKLLERSADISRRLGLDRNIRLEADDKTSAVDAIQTLIDEAGQFALDEAIEIKHCETLIGWIVNEFKENQMTITAICPKCGEEFVTRHIPTIAQIQAAKVPEWAEAEQEGYTEEPEEEDS